MTERMCRNCCHYSAPGVKIGECRVNPPALVENDQDRWPTVGAGESCGSFESER